MKRWNKGSMAAVFLASLMALTGCSSTSYPSYDNNKTAAGQYSSVQSSTAPMASNGSNIEVPSADAENAITEDFAREISVDTRKVIKTAALSLESKEFDQTLAQILQIVEQSGGYIEQQSSSGKSLYEKNDYVKRYASITARIPADKLDETVNQLKQVCNATDYREFADDITDQYYDVQAHLDMLKLQESRLLEILSKAQKLSDIIELEQALTQCRYEIEALTGNIRRMDGKVAMSTLELSLDEVVTYTDLTPEPKNFGERVMASLKVSGENITDVLEGILFFVIEELPVVLILLGLLGIVLWILVSIGKAFSKKMPKPPVANYQAGYSVPSYQQQPRQTATEVKTPTVEHDPTEKKE